MACPSCGSAARRPIAPGYWACNEILMVPQPMPTPQGMVMHPQPVPCLTRYHEGVSAVEICACGTFAIGMCKGCNGPVCGDHSGHTVHVPERLNYPWDLAHVLRAVLPLARAVWERTGVR